MEFFQQGSHPLGFYDVSGVAGLERALQQLQR